MGYSKQERRLRMKGAFLILFLIVIILPGCDIFCKDCNDPINAEYQYLNNTDKIIAVVVYSRLKNRSERNTPAVFLDSLVFQPAETRTFKGPSYTPPEDFQNAPFGLPDADSAVVYVADKLIKSYAIFGGAPSQNDTSNILDYSRYQVEIGKSLTTYSYTFGDYF